MNKRWVNHREKEYRDEILAKLANFLACTNSNICISDPVKKLLISMFGGGAVWDNQSGVIVLELLKNTLTKAREQSDDGCKNSIETWFSSIKDDLKDIICYYDLYGNPLIKDEIPIVKYKDFLDTPTERFNSDIVICDPTCISKDNLDTCRFKNYISHSTKPDHMLFSIKQEDTGNIARSISVSSGQVAVLSLNEVKKYNPGFDTNHTGIMIIHDFQGSAKISVDVKSDVEYEIILKVKGMNSKTKEPINLIASL